jgi:hypothetical protein
MADTLKKRHMRSPKEYQRLDRKVRVSELYREGWTLAAIAGELDTTIPTVAKDLDEVREEWTAKALRNYDAHKAEQLAKIDYVEAQAWESFRLSQEPAMEVIKVVERALRKTEQPPPDKGRQAKAPAASLQVIKELTRRVKRGQAPGDERWLARVAWCIETRCKILNLIQPNQTNVNVVQINWDELTGPSDGGVESDPVEAKIQALANGEDSDNGT